MFVVCMYVSGSVKVHKFKYAWYSHAVLSSTYQSAHVTFMIFLGMLE